MPDDRLTRAYLLGERADLLEAKRQLVAMSEKYGKAKAAFDAKMEARGIDPNDPLGLVAYQDQKTLHPELGFWYSKVEHWQREVTARASYIMALEAIHRMVGPGA